MTKLVGQPTKVPSKKTPGNKAPAYKLAPLKRSPPTSSKKVKLNKLAKEKKVSEDLSEFKDLTIQTTTDSGDIEEEENIELVELVDYFPEIQSPSTPVDAYDSEVVVKLAEDLKVLKLEPEVINEFTPLKEGEIYLPKGSSFHGRILAENSIYSKPTPLNPELMGGQSTRVDYNLVMVDGIETEVQVQYGTGKYWLYRHEDHTPKDLPPPKHKLMPRMYCHNNTMVWYPTYCFNMTYEEIYTPVNFFFTPKVMASLGSMILDYIPQVRAPVLTMKVDKKFHSWIPGYVAYPELSGSRPLPCFYNESFIVALPRGTNANGLCSLCFDPVKNDSCKCPLYGDLTCVTKTYQSVVRKDEFVDESILTYQGDTYMTSMNTFTNAGLNLPMNYVKPGKGSIFLKKMKDLFTIDPVSCLDEMKVGLPKKEEPPRQEEEKVDSGVQSGGLIEEKDEMDDVTLSDSSSSDEIKTVTKIETKKEESFLSGVHTFIFTTVVGSLKDTLQKNKAKILEKLNFGGEDTMSYVGTVLYEFAMTALDFVKDNPKFIGAVVAIVFVVCNLRKLYSHALDFYSGEIVGQLPLESVFPLDGILGAIGDNAAVSIVAALSLQSVWAGAVKSEEKGDLMSLLTGVINGSTTFVAVIGSLLSAINLAAYARKKHPVRKFNTLTGKPVKSVLRNLPQVKYHAQFEEEAKPEVKPEVNDGVVFRDTNQHARQFEDVKAEPFVAKIDTSFQVTKGPESKANKYCFVCRTIHVLPRCKRVKNGAKLEKALPEKKITSKIDVKLEQFYCKFCAKNHRVLPGQGCPLHKVYKDGKVVVKQKESPPPLIQEIEQHTKKGKVKGRAQEFTERQQKKAGHSHTGKVNLNDINFYTDAKGEYADVWGERFRNEILEELKEYREINREIDEEVAYEDFMEWRKEHYIEEGTKDISGVGRDKSGKPYMVYNSKQPVVQTKLFSKPKQIYGLLVLKDPEILTHSLQSLDKTEKLDKTCETDKVFDEVEKHSKIPLRSVGNNVVKMGTSTDTIGYGYVIGVNYIIAPGHYKDVTHVYAPKALPVTLVKKIVAKHDNIHIYRCDTKLTVRDFPLALPKSEFPALITAPAFTQVSSAVYNPTEGLLTYTIDSVAGDCGQPVIDAETGCIVGIHIGVNKLQKVARVAYATAFTETVLREIKDFTASSGF
jgi:hypothetical protein